MFTACSKEEGEGGTSTITGKVKIREYNYFGDPTGKEYYAPEEDVYIIYGDDDIYSDRFRTNYDGSYRFQYLRQGKYTVFAYADDLSGESQSGKIPVMKIVKITENDQNKTVEDIVLNKFE
jgi:hypothetical protein